MKAAKKILMGTVIILAALVLTNCTSVPAESGRPAWITKIPPEDDESVYFVGYSHVPNLSRARTRAEIDARMQFTRWKESTIKVEISETDDSTSASTTTKIYAVNNTTNGQIREIWQDPEGGVYVLMSFSKKPDAENNLQE